MVQLEEFGALGLTDVTLEAIKAKGFETPSPIQKLTIPVLLDDEKTLRKKVMRAVTDEGPQTPNSPKSEPIANLFTIMKSRFI